MDLYYVLKVLCLNSWSMKFVNIIIIYVWYLLILWQFVWRNFFCSEWNWNQDVVYLRNWIVNIIVKIWHYSCVQNCSHVWHCSWHNIIKFFREWHATTCLNCVATWYYSYDTIHIILFTWHCSHARIVKKL